MSLNLLFAALFLVVVGVLTFRSRQTATLGIRVATATLLFVTACVSLWSVVAVFAPGDPIATGSVTADTSLRFSSTGSATRLLVHGDLPPVGSGAQARVAYSLRTFVDDEPGPVLDGLFEEHFERRRVTRKASGNVLVVKDTKPYDLPAAATGAEVRVELAELSGSAVDSLRLSVVRAPPSSTWLAMFLGVLVLFAAGVDAVEGGYRAVGVAVLAAFGLLAPSSARPDSPPQTVAVLGALAGMAGIIVGGAVRAIAVRVRSPRSQEPAAERWSMRT